MFLNVGVEFSYNKFISFVFISVPSSVCSHLRTASASRADTTVLYHRVHTHSK